MRITKLEPQKKRKDRWNLYVDDQFYCGLDEDVVLALGLKIGQDITPKIISDMEGGENTAKAWNSFLGLIKARDRSEREVRDRLQKKGFDNSVVERVISKALRLDFLDDKRFSEMWVRERKTVNLKGKKAIYSELLQKGVGREIIEEVISENFNDDDELSLAQEVYEKKLRVWSDMSDPKTKEKMIRHLAGKGFGWGVIEKIINS